MNVHNYVYWILEDRRGQKLQSNRTHLLVQARGRTSCRIFVPRAEEGSDSVACKTDLENV